MAYQRTTIQEREEIFKLINQGLTQKEIAQALHRSPSTISREIRRDGTHRETYSPTQAHNHAKYQALARRRKNRLIQGTKLANFVRDKLKMRWSPEQISVYLKFQPIDSNSKVSHETIYQYIYSQEDPNDRKVLIGCLRQKRKLRRKRRKTQEKRGQIPHLVSIHDRPKEADNRQIPGHWEGDTVIGKRHKSALGTMVDRTTRFCQIQLFDQGINSEEVALAFSSVFEVLPLHLKKSFTYDRGREMYHHQVLTSKTEVPVYFADPHSPWQRGTNENTNGLIRDFFPKGTDFRKVLEEEVFEVERLINTRPRKVLGYRTPQEAIQWFCKNPTSTLEEFLQEMRYR